jgi:hypothetical protein
MNNDHPFQQDLLTGQAREPSISADCIGATSVNNDIPAA